MDKQETLATELLHELKANSKRWFIISIIELVIILTITGLFVWYIYQPIEETTVEYSQDADTEGDESPIEQTTEVQNKNNLSNLNSVDFWTVMNMAYNDYHAMFGEDLNSYINFTKLFITDEDSGENKVFRYFTEII